MRSYKEDHQNARRLRFGWRISSYGYQMVDTQQQLIIAKIFHLRNEGSKLQDICDRLNNEGIQTPRNGRWHCSTIKKILDQNSTSYVNRK